MTVENCLYVVSYFHLRHADSQILILDSTRDTDTFVLKNAKYYPEKIPILYLLRSQLI